jgi:LmbE family N-acetylglucosaminyl deacetylase
MTTRFDPGIPTSAIALLAHPDDPEFTAGGTIARWTAAGCRMSYVLMTDGRAGNAGIRDTPLAAEALVRRRQEEQQAAGALLGVAAEDIVFFDYHDGELMHTLELRRQLAREIRRHKPEAAILFDPQRRVMPGYVQHPDHWTSGEAALAALMPLAGNPLAFPELLTEGLEPHQVRDLYLVSPAQPNLRVDIGATLDQKIQAMLCHTSQVADPQRLDTLLRDMARMTAMGTDFEYAEAFHFIRMGERNLVLEG